jgi:hypothetical protein
MYGFIESNHRDGKILRTPPERAECDAYPLYKQNKSQTKTANISVAENIQVMTPYLPHWGIRRYSDWRMIKTSRIGGSPAAFIALI